VSSDRFIAMTGWVGEHPVDGGDVAHLLLYPTSSDYSTDVRQLSEFLGLGLASAQMVEVDPSRCSASVAADGWVHLRAGADEIAAIPTNALWCAAAEHRKYLMLTLGVAPWNGDHISLEGYVADLGELYMGLLVCT
jgi:hypothetical protein